MKKVITKPLIMVAFLAAVLGVSSVPSSAGAESGRDWNDNSWNRNSHDWKDDNGHDWNNNSNRWHNNYNRWHDDGNRWHRVSDWESRSIAQNHFPGRWIVSENQWWGHDGRLQRQYHFNDNHVIVIRDDGVIIIIIQQ